MSIGTQSQTESRHLSSSITSLHRNSKKSTSEISRTYKHAAQLYLTRRLAECYETLQPVISPVQEQEKGRANGNVSQSEDESSSPRTIIATASTSQRIKIWSLYATLLNTILELDDAEGKQDFGVKLYRDIVRNVQSGEVWEQVVRDGYMGREASVDAEVVYNLSNLLLGQAPDQKVNQARLETYLSSSPHGNLDFSSAFENGTARAHSNGANTPRDLNSRVKILELFTLHVLPRNDEWDYARSFVSNSDILDDERRDAFLQTLTELQEAREAEEAEAEQDLVGFGDETEDDDYEKDYEAQRDRDRIRMDERNDDDQQSVETSFKTNGLDPDITSPSELAPHRAGRPLHRRSSSEVDYGIDDHSAAANTSHVVSPSQTQKPRFASPPPPTPTTTASIKSPPLSQKSSPPAPSSLQRLPQPSQSKPPAKSKPKPRRQSSTPPPTRLAHFINVVRTLSTNLTKSISRNPTSVFRLLMFLIAFLAVFAKRQVRERVRRVLGVWGDKVQKTVGVGMKVSYI